MIYRATAGKLLPAPGIRHRRRRHRSLGQLSPREFEDRRVIEDHQIKMAVSTAA
jgi:hypothetical protein